MTMDPLHLVQTGASGQRPDLWRPDELLVGFRRPQKAGGGRSRAAVTAVALCSFLLGATSAVGQSRFEDVRLIVDRLNERFDDEKGVLTSDVSARQLRFETSGRVLLEVPFDRLLSLHYEESKYPVRFFGRVGPYLTIHHLRDAGEPAFAILRLSKDSAPGLLKTLESDTGLPVDRTPPTTSFLGLPIHLTPGYPVYVTNSTGRRIKGEIAGLSQSAIDLGKLGRFEAASVRRIEVIDPVWDGAVLGAILLGYPLALVHVDRTYNCDDCSDLPGLGGYAIGAVVGALIDRRVNRVAYRAPESRASPRVAWGPVFDNNRKGLHLSLRF